jgi:hypothetical protein
MDRRIERYYLVYFFLFFSLNFFQKPQGQKEMSLLHPLPPPATIHLHIIYVIMSWKAETYSLRVKLFASNPFPEFRALILQSENII